MINFAFERIADYLTGADIIDRELIWSWNAKRLIKDGYKPK